MDIKGIIELKSQIIGQLSGQLSIGGLIFNDVNLTDGHIIFTLVDNTMVDGGKVVFEYSDFTPEQLALLKGEHGDAFVYEDFTPEQLAFLKGDPGYTPIKGIDYFDGVDATPYTHPANHAPSVISQDASNQFVTDTEKSTWNGKLVPGGKISLLNTLDAGRQSVVLGVISDSTANETTEWVYLLGQRLATKYPLYNVKYKNYNSPTDFNAWVNIQNVGDERCINFIKGKECLYMPKADVPITSADLDISFRLSLDNWGEAASKNLFGRYGAAGARSFFVTITATGVFSLYWSANGTDLLGAVFSTHSTLALTNGTGYWYRVSLDVDDGAGHYVAKLYNSTDGVTWTILQTITGASTTVIFDHATTPYLIGGYGTSSMAGKFYEIRIRDGIDGVIANPQPIESWKRIATDAYSGGTIVGSPTIYIYNGSYGGFGMTNFLDLPTLKKMVVPSFGGTQFISFSHNDGYNTGSVYMDNFNTVITNLKARIKYPNLCLVTQNPKLAPADGVYDHDSRRLSQISYCSNSNIDVIDAYREFMLDSRGLAALINVDGVHPNSTGEQLIIDTIAKYFNI